MYCRNIFKCVFDQRKFQQ